MASEIRRPDKPSAGRSDRAPVHLGRAELPLQLLIIATLAVLTFETLPNLKPWQVKALEYFEWFSLSVFSIEYLVRLWLTRPWHRYAFSFFG